MKTKLNSLALTATLFLAAAGSGNAATVNIQEPAEGSTDWTFIISGLSDPNSYGGLNGTFVVGAGSEALGPVSYTSDGRALATAQYFVSLYEDAAKTLVSDNIIVSTTQGSANISIQVISDTEGGAPLTAYPGFVEDGTFQTLVTISKDGGLSDTDTISLMSDIETVPEPSQLATMALTVAGIGTFVRRRYVAKNAKK